MNNITITKCERIGRFTFAEAIDTNGVRGVGVSRRGFADKMNDALGKTIAEGRARAAIYKKANKKPIMSAFMG